MDYIIALLLSLLFTSTFSASIIQQPLMPLQYWMQPQNSPIQLQNPFLRRTVNNIQPPIMYPQRPILVLLRNPAHIIQANDRYLNFNEEEVTNRLKTNTGHTDEDNDAVVIDAEPYSEDVGFKKPVILMPNYPRFSIGGIISTIPFLPIEINVPDTIGWIAGLFPGWFPSGWFPNGWFGGSAQKPGNMTRLSSKGPVPVLLLPEQMMAAI